MVYLRRIYYPAGFAFPLRLIDPDILRVELVREAATLVMLLAAAMLAGRTRWGRFGYFLVAFGVWDLVYYLGLKVALGWPAGWGEWDILFLLPLPWIAPVYAPAAVALGMIVAGILIARLEAAGFELRGDLWMWLLAGAGTAAILWSFTHDREGGLGRAVPRDYPVGALVAGMALYATALWRLILPPRRGQGAAG